MTAAAKQKPTTVRLEAGTPISGTVKFVDFYPEKPNPNEPGKTFSAQWAFTGDLDGQYAKVYIDTYQLDENPVNAGLVAQAGQWPDGNPKFKWVGVGAVTFTKRLKDKRAHVHITAASAGAGAVAPAASSGAPAGRSTVAAPASAPTPIAGWWDEQVALMAHCFLASARVHTDLDRPDDVTKTAHSFYIQANREGKLAPPSAQQQAESIRATFDALPEALQDGPVDDDLPAWLK